MKNNNIFRLFLVSVMFFLTTNTDAQVANFKENQRLHIGGGESLEIITCKGEAEEQHCQLKYYLNQKQIGKPFWLKSASIAKHLNHRKHPQPEIGFAKTRAIPIHKILIIEKPVVEDKIVSKKENASVQADMLAMAKRLAQQPSHAKPESEKKEQKSQKK